MKTFPQILVGVNKENTSANFQRKMLSCWSMEVFIIFKSECMASAKQ